MWSGDFRGHVADQNLADLCLGGVLDMEHADFAATLDKGDDGAFVERRLALDVRRPLRALDGFGFSRRPK